ncbi:MAG: hypothetical protein LC679_05800 [Intrasporangiaceae bacterium]|nr:hypothetical protein [Intrasporangiaceae bacterium]
MEVIALLTEAADLGSTQIGRRPQHHSLALGAESVVGKMVALLEEADRARLDEVAEAEQFLHGVSFDVCRRAPPR